MGIWRLVYECLIIQDTVYCNILRPIVFHVDKGQMFFNWRYIFGNFCLEVDLTDQDILWIAIQLFHVGNQPGGEPTPGHITQESSWVKQKCLASQILPSQSWVNKVFVLALTLPCPIFCGVWGLVGIFCLCIFSATHGSNTAFFCGDSSIIFNLFCSAKINSSLWSSYTLLLWMTLLKFSLVKLLWVNCWVGQEEIMVDSSV